MSRRPPGDLLALPAPAARARVTTSDGTRLNVETHGRPDPARPVVVLVHGWTCSIPFWAPVIRALDGEFQVVAYDLRGHGASEQPAAGGCSIEALAADLEAVLEHAVPPGQSAILAGHSMGGMAIMAAARGEPVRSRARGVLLASTGAANLVAEALAVPFGAFLPAISTVQYWLLTSAAPLGPFSEQLLRHLTLGRGATGEQAAANAAIIAACDRRARSAWGHVLATLDVTAGARSLDVPAHVLVGTADRLTPPAQSRRLARLLPRLEGVTELAGIGHMTPLEAPDVVAGLIRELALAAGDGGAAGGSAGADPAGGRMMRREGG